MEKMKTRIDYQAQEYLNSLKKLHENEIEVLYSEIGKIRNLLDVKNKEIDTLIDQNRGLKVNFDTEKAILRQDICGFKEKIAQSNDFVQF